MSTSGGGEQYFVAEGRRYAHILDPRTGCPADRNLLTSVVASSAMLAEALSTAFFVMESGDVGWYCARNRNIGAIIFSSPTDDSSETPLTLGEAFTCMEERSK